MEKKDLIATQISKEEQYWTKILGEDFNKSHIPYDYPISNTLDVEFKSLKFEINPSSVDHLNQISNDSEVKLQFLLTSALFVLVKKMTNDEDLSIGTTIFKQKRNAEFINTLLVLRNLFDEKKSFKELLIKTKDIIIEAYQNQNYNLNDIIKSLKIRYGINDFYPFFDIVLLLKELHSLDYLQDIKYNLLFLFYKENNTISCDIKYNSKLYKEESIHHIFQLYNLILSSCLNNIDKPINEIDVISNEERELLVNKFNDSRKDYLQKSVLDLFVEKAKDVPDNIAIHYNSIENSYKELDEKSNSLANYLISLDVKSRVIAIHLEPSTDLIISILGVLKAGAVFLPIDINLPQERKKYMLLDSNAYLIISSELLGLGNPFNDKTIELKNIPEKNTILSRNYDLTINGNAYIIYTSGTTGRPKGALIKHIGLANYIKWASDVYVLGEETNFPLFTSISFDLTITSIFTPLITGNAIVIYNGQSTPEMLNDIFNQDNIGVVKLTPTHLKILNYIRKESINSINQNRSGVKRIILGGEQINPLDIVEFNKVYKNVEIFNEYGPTETVVGSIIYKIDINIIYSENILVGKPIYNTQIYIMNADLKLVPIGAIGEIYIGGYGVAKGYLNNVNLTDSKFLDNPFENNKKIYKTGDLARWRSDGNIEFFGRIDNQVKINGYRIELNEIEFLLRGNEFIDDAVVVVKERDGDKYLVAYYVSKTVIEKSELRSYLAIRLPDYMVPAFYVCIESIPFTSNGKLNSIALPEPDINVVENYEAPKTQNENLIVDVWSEVLGIEKIGVTDNFFSLGGDSIKSIQVSSRLRSKGYEISVKEIYSYPTIKALSLILKDTVKIIDQSATTGRIPLTPVQHWFFNNSIVNKHHFNQSVLLDFNEGITIAIVKSIFSKLQEHHDALRIVFQNSGNEINQQYKGLDIPVTVLEYDLKDLEDPKSKLLLLCNQVQESIDLENGPLMKLGLFHLKDGTRLLIVIHHLIIDGISWRILLEDIEHLYRQTINGDFLSLQYKTDSFQLWSNSLLKYKETKIYKRAQKYWDSFFIKKYELIPIEKVKGENWVKNSKKETLSLNSELTEKLLTGTHSSFNLQTNDVLLTALLLAVREFYGNNSVRIDLEGHGRENIHQGENVSRTVGWFTNMCPVILEVSEDYNLSDIIKHTKEALRGIPNGGIDYMLYKYESLNNSSNYSKFDDNSQICFNYLGQFDTDVKRNSFSMAKESCGNNMSTSEKGEYLWSISGIVYDSQLHISLTYCDEQFEENTINSFMGLYKSNLIKLIEYCSNYNKVDLTPSDLTYREISIKQLDELQNKFDIEDIYPLTPMQEGMLFHSLFDSNSENYFVQLTVFLKGKLNKAFVERSMEDLIKRHDILRTVFLHEGYERPIQVLIKERTVDFTFKDIQDECLNNPKEEVVRKYQENNKDRKFDLSKDILIRLSLYQVSGEEYFIILSYHHVLMDGWCSGILINEFREIYSQYTNNQRISLPQTVPYSTYIKWLENKEKEDAIRYWKNYLNGYDYKIVLPQMNSSVSVSSKKHVFVKHVIDKERTKGLHEISRKNNVTLNTIIQCAWGILLSRYNNSNDIVFGAVVSGRTSEIEGIETMVGLFINTIPVRMQFNNDDKISQLLISLQESASEREFYHYYPLSEIQSFSKLGRELINHILVFENFPIADKLMGVDDEYYQEEFNINKVEVFEHANYDLNVVISSNDVITFKINFNPEKYNSENIENLFSHLINIFDSIINNCEIPFSKIEITSQEERTQLIQIHNHKTVDYPKDKTIIDLFNEQVIRIPDNIAVKFGYDSITYHELDKISSQIAFNLKRYNIRSTKIIGLLMDRGIDLIISVLAILKSGAAYLPIDEEYPKERISYVIENSKISLLLTSKKRKGKIACQATQIYFEELKEVSDGIFEIEYNIKPNDLCYIIYTSGTSGKPKGVMVEHKNIVRLFFNDNFQFHFNSKDIWALCHNYCFDFSVWEIFGALFNGGQLLIMPNVKDLHSGDYVEILRNNCVTVLNQTPSSFNLILEQEISATSKNLRFRYIIFGGETLQLGKLKKWKQKYPETLLINMYGTTETTVHVTYKEIGYKEIEENINNIGIPIPTLSVYILDRFKKVVPKGIIGEIYVGGEGVARGYLNNKKLTNEKFIRHPYIKDEVIYRTGDYARWLPDSKIEYIGRTDNQVKINGYRIELGEIEESIKQYTEEFAVQSNFKYEPSYDTKHIKRCNKCLITSNYPGIEFDDQGVCSVCSDYNEYKKHIDGYFKEEESLTTFFSNNKFKEREYDCLLLYSGGKDSTYTLYKLIEMGLNVLCFTFDNGFISDVTFKNINETTSKLNVKSIIRRSNKTNKVFLHSLKTKDDICSGCWNALNSIGIQVAEEYSIDTIVSGLSRGQIVEMRLEGLMHAGIKNEKEINDNLLLFRESFHSKSNVFFNLLGIEISKDFLSRLNFIDYFRYDSIDTDGIKKYLKENRWVEPSDTGFCSTNCLINDLGIYYFLDKRGYHFYEAPLSWDTRMKVINRKKGIAELETTFNIEHINNLLNELGYFEPLRIEDVTVIAKQENNNNQYLCSYFVSNRTVNENMLKSYLENLLPEYMVPKVFIQLGEIPITTNGKLNIDILPDPRSKNKGLCLRPSNEIEERLVEIWSQVLMLNKEEISINDNFFELGGHSIKAINLSNRIEESFMIKIELKDVFNNPTIEYLSKYILSKKTEKTTIIPKAEKMEFYPTSYAQERLYYKQILNKSHLTDNISRVYEIIGEFDVNKIEKTFQLLINRHEALRTGIKTYGESVIQQIYDDVNFKLSFLNEKDHGALTKSFDIFTKSFNLSEPPLMRGVIYQTEKNDFYLFFCIHHIICDGISLNILLNEFKYIYNGGCLESLNLKYVDFTIWQKNSNKSLIQQKDFWSNHLTGYLPTINLPTKQNRDLVEVYKAEMKTIVLGKEQYQKIKKTALLTNVSEFVFMLSSYYLLLSKLSGDDEVIVGTAAIGRSQECLENMVGTFVNILPLRLILPESISFKELLDDVKEIVLDAYENQDFQYDQMFSLIGTKENEKIFNVFFSFTDFIESRIELDNLEFAPVKLEQDSKITRYELELNINKSKDDLILNFHYSSELYDEDTIDYFIEYYNQLLIHVLDDIEVDINMIEFEDSLNY